MNQIEYLVRKSQEDSDWVAQVTFIGRLRAELCAKRKTSSIRHIASLINKSKTWTDISLKLSKGLQEFPEIKSLPRITAYRYLRKKELE